MERNLAPVIVFSFSKKECESYALEMSRLDCNTGKTDLLLLKFLINKFLLSYSQREESCRRSIHKRYRHS